MFSVLNKNTSTIFRTKRYVVNSSECLTAGQQKASMPPSALKLRFAVLLQPQRRLFKTKSLSDVDSIETTRQAAERWQCPIALQQWRRDTEDSDSFPWKKKRRHRSVWPCLSTEHHSLLSPFRVILTTMRARKIILLRAKKKGHIKPLQLRKDTIMSQKGRKRNLGIQKKKTCFLREVFLAKGKKTKK